MARLQTLELPEGSADDRPPFILVVDQYEPPPYPADVNDPGPFDGIAEKIGARAVLVFENTIDIPANDTSAYLGREDSGDGSDEGWTEANKAHADVVDWLKVRDKDAELRAANEWVERLGAEAREARAAVARVRNLHRPVEHGGITICAECSGWDGSTTDNSPCGYEHCPTLRALDSQPAPDA